MLHTKVDQETKWQNDLERAPRRPRVCSVNDGESVILVAGRHRLEAAIRLGWAKIPVIFVAGTDDDFRLWEIAENLHRAELTVLERSEHIAEWIRLTDKTVAEQPGVLAQLGPKLSKRDRQGEGRPEGGVRAAARDLGVDRKKAQRAIDIDKIIPEAKQAARDAGLDKNQSALLKVASAPPERQVATVHKVVAEKAGLRADREARDDEGDRRRLRWLLAPRGLRLAGV